MKKIILLFILGFIFTGCSLDEDEPSSIKQVLVPIESVEMADSFVLGETYTIKVNYKRPTHCHIFSGVSYDKEGQTQFFGVLNSFDSEDETCIEVDGLTGNTSFEFVAATNNLYIFKFWQGVDENGDGIYLEIEVPVNEV